MLINLIFKINSFVASGLGFRLLLRGTFRSRFPRGKDDAYMMMQALLPP
jgi:hypothetical protein